MTKFLLFTVCFSKFSKPEDFKVVPGYVESLKIQPGNDQNVS